MGKNKAQAKKGGKKHGKASKHDSGKTKVQKQASKVSKESPKAKEKGKKSKKTMSVDDFFGGGFATAANNELLDKELDQIDQVEVGLDSDDDDAFFNTPAPKSASKANVVDEDGDSSMDEVVDEVDEQAQEASDSDDVDMELDAEEDEDEKDESEKDDDDSASDDASDSDEDDEEGGDSKEKLKRDAERHKQEMEELKKRDPEFYKYLSKEDAELLDFDMSDEEAGDAGSDAEEQEDDESAEEESDADGMGGFDDADLTTVTASMLASWVAQIEKKGDIKAARRLFAAFKSATKMNDEEEREKHNFVYKIVDPEVFNKVLTSAMHYAPIVFDRHLKSKPGANPRKSKSWSHLQSMVKSYLHNMLYLLKSLTDVNMQYLAVQEAEKCTAYWVCFERLPKDYLKVLLNMYSSMGSSDNVRIQSFLAIRSLASTSHHTSQKKDKDEPMLDLCLKYTYLEFVRTCKNTNAHTLPSINLMRNLAVDLFGLDHDASYQQAFVYIRQLAVHLRGAMQTRSDETYKAVYNWQYIHCIDFWTNVLATYCQPSDDTDQESPLKSLIYPLSQVALGAVRLIPTAQYYPLRFHILKSLASLSRATKTYITLVPYILEVLNSTELQNKAKPSTAKALDWDVILRAPKTYLHGRVYQDGIIEQVVAAMDLALSPYYHDLSFPELAIPAIVGIKRFVKKSGNVKGNGKLLKLVHTLEAKSNSVLLQRSRVDFAPIDAEAESYVLA